MSTDIVRSHTPEEEELARKLAELAALETQLADRELDLATLLSELHIFERRYLHVVGVRYAELDELRAQIAEARAQQLTDDPCAQENAAGARAQAEDSAQTASEAQEVPAPPEFEPSETLRKLYRTAAKSLHPDLATDAEEHARRTSLMIEVNHAYEESDEARLQEIIREWETSPEAVKGEGPGVELVRAIRKIAQVRARLEVIEMDIDRVRKSPVYELKVKVEEAESEGRDLLAEMAGALERRIAVAKDDLGEIVNGDIEA